MNHLAIYIFLLFLVLSCEKPNLEEDYQPNYTPEINVFSMISTDEKDEFVVVARTLELTENDSILHGGDISYLISDARVYIINGTDSVQFFYTENVDNNDDRIQPRDNNENNERRITSMYLDRDNKFKAEVGKTYQLLVILKDGRRVTGSTTVPEIPTVKKPIELSVLKASEIKKLVVQWEENPNIFAYQLRFIITLLDKDKPRTQNLINRALTRETEFNLLFLDDFLLVTNIIPILDTVTIRLQGMDRNSYDYFSKSRLASFIGTDLKLLEGGVGVFGSYSATNRKFIIDFNK